MKKIVVVSDNHGSFFAVDMIKVEHQDAHLLVALALVIVRAI